MSTKPTSRKKVLKKSDTDEIESKETESKETESKEIRYVSYLKEELDSIFSIEDFEELNRKLKLGEFRNSKEKILQSIDEIADDFKKAGFYYFKVSSEYDNFKELIFKVWYAKAYTEALEALNELKKEGKVAGQITETKIENYIIENNEKYSEMMERKLELRLARDTFKALYEAYESRKSLIQTQARFISSTDNASKQNII